MFGSRHRLLNFGALSLRRFGWLWLAALLFFGLLTPAVAENRLALVIGNGDYKTAPLANPVNDAERMAEALTDVGFEVRTVRNANQEAMKKEILAFGRRLADGDSVGLFYYAGHGVQIDGQNYLIPLEVDIQDGADIPLLGVNLSVLLRSMGRARSRLNIAILDACRDNPFAGRARSLGRGLAPIEAPSGTLIAYATAPGQVALDGQGGNSPYTAALVDAIPTTGIPIEDVFRQTRRKVLEVTGGRQTPWEHSSLTAAFYFLPKVLEPEISNRNENGLRDPSRDKRLAELAAWEKIGDSAQAADLRRHIQAYPDGLFVELASLKLEQFDKSSAPWTWIITGSSGRTGSRTAASFYEEALRLETSAAANDVAPLRQAFPLYQQAADLGLPVAMYRLARFYDKGMGTAQDFRLAATWYARAANEGHIGAAAALGTMHEFGQGTDSNLVEALRLYQSAADRGDAFAMASLGYLYAEGKGVARNRAKALDWYTRAANQGQSRAMFNLGLLQLADKGSRSNARRGVAWLKKAADHGHTGAQRELAVLYDEGRTVKRDTKLAAKYLLAAFGAGDNRAAFDIRVRPDTWSFWTRRQIQKRLRKLGFYEGHAHGFFDSRTKIALESFAESSERTQQASL